MQYSKVGEQFGSWGEKLRPFIESKKWDDIFASLKKDSREGKIICPESKDLFRAFKECPYGDLKVIFILQDPYPWIKNGIYVADGIAMSCRNTGVCQPSLDLFYDGISSDLGKEVVHHPDLTYLANQGVLFLNTSLTVELNKPNSHKDKWGPFIDYLLGEVINYYQTFDSLGIIYVCLGKNADIVGKAIVPFLHIGMTVEHPAAAAHRQRKWQHEKIFSKINNILRENHLTQIIWNYEDFTTEKSKLSLNRSLSGE